MYCDDHPKGLLLSFVTGEVISSAARPDLRVAPYVIHPASCILEAGSSLSLVSQILRSSPNIGRAPLRYNAIDIPNDSRVRGLTLPHETRPDAVASSFCRARPPTERKIRRESRLPPRHEPGFGIKHASRFSPRYTCTPLAAIRTPSWPPICPVLSGWLSRESVSTTGRPRALLPCVADCPDPV